MRKKLGITCTILLICLICLYEVLQKPKIVSCITTMDTAYLTVIANGHFFSDKNKFALEIVEMCKENTFDDIKLSTQSGIYPSKLYITVYRRKEQMDGGSVWMTIVYNSSENAIKVL